ncbi:hypothetical protein, partial [Aeromonas allosaccharophila]|uniref:hypothetical protein n=1 Tax=Aeromonas allosaccharophila TaxID=656 RepID=UPI003D2318E3
RNPSRSKKRLLKTALRDNYLEKRRVREAIGDDAIAAVIPPFLGAFKSRGHAAFARCCFGV